MKILSTTFLLFGLLMCAKAAQHTVTVANMTFSPGDLFINQNDTVNFVFTSGFHTVTSETDAWPEISGSSPAEFQLFEPFRVAGTYEYFCKPHVSMGMRGSITVVSVLNTISISEGLNINIFPNPCTDKISITINKQLEATDIKITDQSGREIVSLPCDGAKLYEIDLSTQEPGIYFCSIYKNAAILENRKIVVK